MLNYVKTPRSVAEFTLMKGVTDFSNLRQFDLYETSYGFMYVCSVPKFMDLLGNRNAKVRNLQDMFVHIIEGEFKGIDGIPDITADAGTIGNGANEVQIINNITQDTSIQVTMNYYERSGGALTNYITTYLTGIKDPNSKAKTYHGLIAMVRFLIPALTMRYSHCCIWLQTTHVESWRRHTFWQMLSLHRLLQRRCTISSVETSSSRRLPSRSTASRLQTIVSICMLENCWSTLWNMLRKTRGSSWIPTTSTMRYSTVLWRVGAPSLQAKSTLCLQLRLLQSIPTQGNKNNNVSEGASAPSELFFLCTLT